MILQPMLIEERESHLSSLMLLANIDREEDFSVSPVLRRRWLVVHHERQAGRWIPSWGEIILLLSLIYKKTKTDMLVFQIQRREVSYLGIDI